MNLQKRLQTNHDALEDEIKNQWGKYLNENYFPTEPDRRDFTTNIVFNRILRNRLIRTPTEPQGHWATKKEVDEWMRTASIEYDKAKAIEKTRIENEERKKREERTVTNLLAEKMRRAEILRRQELEADARLNIRENEVVNEVLDQIPPPVRDAIFQNPFIIPQAPPNTEDGTFKERLLPRRAVRPRNVPLGYMATTGDERDPPMDLEAIHREVQEVGRADRPRKSITPIIRRDMNQVGPVDDFEIRFHFRLAIGQNNRELPVFRFNSVNLDRLLHDIQNTPRDAIPIRQTGDDIDTLTAYWSDRLDTLLRGLYYNREQIALEREFSHQEIDNLALVSMESEVLEEGRNPGVIALDNMSASIWDRPLNANSMREHANVSNLIFDNQTGPIMDPLNRTRYTYWGASTWSMAIRVVKLINRLSVDINRTIGVAQINLPLVNYTLDLNNEIRNTFGGEGVVDLDVWQNYILMMSGIMWDLLLNITQLSNGNLAVRFQLGLTYRSRIVPERGWWPVAADQTFELNDVYWVINPQNTGPQTIGDVWIVGGQVDFQYQVSDLILKYLSQTTEDYEESSPGFLSQVRLNNITISLKNINHQNRNPENIEKYAQHLETALDAIFHWGDFRWPSIFQNVIWNINTTHVHSDYRDLYLKPQPFICLRHVILYLVMWYLNLGQQKSISLIEGSTNIYKTLMNNIIKTNGVSGLESIINLFESFIDNIEETEDFRYQQYINILVITDDWMTYQLFRHSQNGPCVIITPIAENNTSHVGVMSMDKMDTLITTIQTRIQANKFVPQEIMTREQVRFNRANNIKKELKHDDINVKNFLYRYNKLTDGSHYNKNFNIFLDIETYTHGDRKPYLLCYIVGNHLLRDAIWGLDCIEKFVTGLATICEKLKLCDGSTLNLWAHNGAKFDFIYFLPFIHTKFQIKGTVTDVKSLSFIVNHSGGSTTIRTYDFFLTMGTSLNNLAKIYCNGEQKKDNKVLFEFTDIRNLSGTTTKEIIEYCYQDCHLLADIYTNFKTTINKIVLKFPNGKSSTLNCPNEWISSASLVNLLFKKHCLYKNGEEKIYGLSRPVYNDVQSSYFGGYTQVFKQKLDQEGYMYDINSSYPNCMLGFVPYQIETFELVKCDEYTDDINHHFERLWFVKLIEFPTGTPYPLIPSRTKNGNIYALQSTDCWIWGHTLKYITSNEVFKGYKLIVGGYYRFKCQETYKNWVSLFYKFKSTPNISDDIKTFYKLCLNSLYGKTGQKEHLIKTFTKNESEVLEYLKTNPLTSITYHESRKVFELIEKPTNVYPQHEGAICFIASWITSKARLNLFEVLYDCYNKGIDVYYVDTDSVVTNSPIDQKYLDQNIIGKFKLEYGIKRARFWGSKLYYIEKDSGEVKVRAKGFPEQYIKTLHEQIWNLDLEKEIDVLFTTGWKRQWIGDYSGVHNIQMHKIMKTTLSRRSYNINNTSTPWLNVLDYNNFLRDEKIKNK